MSAVLKIIRRQRKRKRRSPSRRPRWQLVLLALSGVATVVGLALIVRAAVFSPWLRVRTVHVRGTVRLTDADFREVLGRHVGEPMLLLDLGRLRADIERLGVREARVARRMPDTLEAVVVERQAVARAELGERTVLVDEDGVVFAPVSPLPGDADLPLMRGLSTAPGAARLEPPDRAGIDALLALRRASGQLPPNTTLDLTPKDKIVLRRGNEPPVWLDRTHPDRNLGNLDAWTDRASKLMPGAILDIRYDKRLTLVPPGLAGTSTE